MALDLENGLTLRLRLEQDLTLTYQAQTQVVQEIIDKGTLLGRNEQKWATRIQQRVLRVEGENAHLVTLSEPDGPPPEILVPGIQVRRQVMYALMDPLGNLLEVSGGVRGSTYSFPEEPVGVGTAWEAQSEVQFPGMLAPVPSTSFFAVAGTEEVQGFACVRIEMSTSEISFDMPLPDGQQTAKVLLENKGTLFFAPEEGLLVRMELRTRSIPKIQDYAFDTTTTLTQELVNWEAPPRQD